MSTRGTFSFKRGNAKVYTITPEFRILLTQIGAQLATLQLVNEQNAVIPYPHGFRIQNTL